ncbi:hypothetical protein J3R83DRAFT_6010 [Lanmaoa asiatica]|nr:hypothetical protein J3R83DRAFT_6010 [Lanmaoa asiatica]
MTSCCYGALSESKFLSIVRLGGSLATHPPYKQPQHDHHHHKLKLAIVQSERPTSNRCVSRRHLKLCVPKRESNTFHSCSPQQLEQTITKLQTALGFTPDQVAALPPPLVQIRELEQENTCLQKENEGMRRLLSESDHRHLSQTTGGTPSVVVTATLRNAKWTIFTS